MDFQTPSRTFSGSNLHLGGGPLSVIGNGTNPNTITVNGVTYRKTKLGGSETATSSLWLGNMDPEADEEELRTLFSQYGTVESVRVLRHAECAFVNFVRVADAQRAMDSLQGAPFGHSRLQIQYQLPREVRQQEKANQLTQRLQTAGSQGKAPTSPTTNITLATASLSTSAPSPSYSQLSSSAPPSTSPLAAAAMAAPGKGLQHGIGMPPRFLPRTLSGNAWQAVDSVGMIMGASPSAASGDRGIASSDLHLRPDLVSPSTDVALDLQSLSLSPSTRDDRERTGGSGRALSGWLEAALGARASSSSIAGSSSSSSLNALASQNAAVTGHHQWNAHLQQQQQQQTLNNANGGDLSMARAALADLQQQAAAASMSPSASGDRSSRLTSWLDGPNSANGHGRPSPSLSSLGGPWSAGNSSSSLNLAAAGGGGASSNNSSSSSLQQLDAHHRAAIAIEMQTLSNSLNELHDRHALSIGMNANGGTGGSPSPLATAGDRVGVGFRENGSASNGLSGQSHGHSASAGTAASYLYSSSAPALAHHHSYSLGPSLLQRQLVQQQLQQHQAQQQLAAIIQHRLEKEQQIQRLDKEQQLQGSTSSLLGTAGSGSGTAGMSAPQGSASSNPIWIPGAPKARPSVSAIGSHVSSKAPGPSSTSAFRPSSAPLQWTTLQAHSLNNSLNCVSPPTPPFSFGPSSLGGGGAGGASIWSHPSSLGHVSNLSPTALSSSPTTLSMFHHTLPAPTPSPSTQALKDDRDGRDRDGAAQGPYPDLF